MLTTPFLFNLPHHLQEAEKRNKQGRWLAGDSSRSYLPPAPRPARPLPPPSLLFRACGSLFWNTEKKKKKTMLACSQPAEPSRTSGSASQCLPFQTQFPHLGRGHNHTPPLGPVLICGRKKQCTLGRGNPVKGRSRFSWGPQVLRSQNRAKLIASCFKD